MTIEEKKELEKLGRFSDTLTEMMEYYGTDSDESTDIMFLISDISSRAEKIHSPNRSLDMKKKL